jgi:acetyl esterase/lipase
MPLDPRVARFLDLLAAGQPAVVHPASVEARRAGLDALMKFAGAPPPVEDVRADTVPSPNGPIGVRIYTPRGAPDALLAGMVYFHGGGLIAGSVVTHDAIARELANAGRCRVVSVEYRLAPEHPFPAAVEDALAATQHIVAQAARYGIDGRRVGVCGDSAGATLAAATCHAMAAAGGQGLALQLLLCPVLDHSRTLPWRRRFESGYLVDRPTLEHELRQYLPCGADPADPRVSPLRSPTFEGIPHTIMHTAEFDPLCEEGAEYAERVSAAGGPVDYTCHPGMIHLFYGLKSVIPHARIAFEQIGREIRSVFG